MYSEFRTKFADTASKLDLLKQESTPFQCSSLEATVWSSFKQRTERFLEKAPQIEYLVQQNTKGRMNQDLFNRRLNVLIDHLTESEGAEDTYEKIMKMIDFVFNEADKCRCKLARAYRLGRKSSLGKPRKIRIEFVDVESRDLFMSYSRELTRVGNDGRIFYINEDIPEALKRKRTDIFRYIKYMQEKGHSIERFGEDFIINGQRWKSQDLNKLPIGDRMLDSRTRYKNGIVAFQSSISPLSILFPAPIIYKGKRYQSLEHCYQHSKAIFHGYPDKAREIDCNDDPYDALYVGKSITESSAWAEQKVGFMESLLRHKEDQVGLFKAILRETGDHKLVKNSWDSFWGTACPFICDAVWTKTFKGANKLGALLEKVRSDT